MSGPWLKFYPSDWRADPRLRMCSIGARGLWIEMLCLMHEAEPYGYLVSNNRAISPRELANLSGISVSNCMKFLLELASSGVYSIDENKRIFSRRMLKDKAKLERDRANGKGGGNPNLTKGVNPQDKAQKPEARSQLPEASKQEAPRAVSYETKSDQSNGAVRALKSDLMEAFGSKRCPDLARASDWIAKGYAPAMVVEVVRSLLARKPDVASLAYFDSALAERHAARVETPSERAAASGSLNLDSVVRLFATTGVWSKYAGPEPGMGGCRVSAEMLAKHGLGVDGQRIREAV